MGRYAIIETSTGLVTNVIELDEGYTWEPPADHHVVAEQDVIALVEDDGETGIKIGATLDEVEGTYESPVEE